MSAQPGEKPNKQDHWLTPADRILRFLGIYTTAVLMDQGHMKPPVGGEEASHIHTTSVEAELKTGNTLLESLKNFLEKVASTDAIKTEREAVTKALEAFAAAHKQLQEDHATKEKPQTKKS